MARIDEKPEVNLPPMSAANTLTWETLSTLQTKNLFVVKYNGYVTYRTFIPLDVMSKIQVKFPGKKASDAQGRTFEMLKYLMINPPITDETAAAVLKADSAILFEIIGDAVGKKEADELEAALGED